MLFSVTDTFAWRLPRSEMVMAGVPAIARLPSSRLTEVTTPAEVAMICSGMSSTLVSNELPASRAENSPAELARLD